MHYICIFIHSKNNDLFAVFIGSMNAGLSIKNVIIYLKREEIFIEYISVRIVKLIFMIGDL